jgi:hypothetical protein
MLGGLAFWAIRKVGEEAVPFRSQMMAVSS